MRMQDRSLIDKINPTFMALTATAIHHYLSVCTTAEFRVPPEFGLGGGARFECDTTNIHHGVNNACQDVFRSLDEDFRSSSQVVQANKIGNIRSMLRRRIYSTGTDPAMAQPHTDQSSSDEDFLEYVPE
jgi:hypothetical protein